MDDTLTANTARHALMGGFIGLVMVMHKEVDISSGSVFFSLFWCVKKH